MSKKLQDKRIYSKADLIRDLEGMGLKPTDKVMVHSSMKAIGEVEGGADTVVDALMDYFQQGLVMVPTHTWKQMSEEYNIFDPETEPACVGIIPNLFRKRQGVYRSLHPTHSIAAYGVGAKEYVQGEENLDTPCDPKGCFGRLKDIGAYILLVGVTHARNTYIHSIEESFDVPERLTEKPTTFQVKLPDGLLKEVPMYRHFNSKEEHISDTFDKFMNGYYELGVARKVTLGDAQCILCEARKLFEATKRILEREINCFIDRVEIPSEWQEISADKVVSKLIDKGWTISFAESCSGGMAAARLVSVPDASKVFAASVVTYANEAKVKYVDVNPQTIEHYGVVSEEVAMEMARGVAKANEAQVGVGISGIAGPTGATATKPVGMVCFGFVVGDKAFSRTCYFGNVGRDVVRRASVNYVYSVLEETLDIIGN